MNDVLAVVIGLALGVLASLPVAMVIAVSTTHKPTRTHCDFTDWYPQDEISEETAVTVYFDGAGYEVQP